MTRALLLTTGLVVVLGGGAVSGEETVVEVIPLSHRSAADLVPPLQTVLGDEVTVTSMDTRLIVRAPRRLMPEVRRLVAQLDVRPRSLWITVRQDRDVEASARSAGAVVAAGPEGVAVGGSLSRGNAAEASGDVHRVRTLEGTAAWISLGTSLPVPSTVIAPAPGGAAVVSGTTYQQVDRGFWVVPRVAGARVTLEIETTLDEARAEGAIETQGVSTTVSGRLGEWIGLGEIAREGESAGSGILSSEQERRRELRTVQVKVDEVP